MSLKPITRRCPMCNKDTTLQLTKKTVDQANAYTLYGGLIQDAIPVDEFDDYRCKAIVREFI